MRKYILFLSLVLAACGTSGRCEYIGCEYLGARYATDPLGEEYGYDADPLIRIDAFDCVTFVEMSMAGGDADKLAKIRYRGAQVDFLERNHFIEYDWVRNNAGLVENVTARYGAAKIRRVYLDRKNWFKKNHGMDVGLYNAWVDVAYIPYSDLGPINADAPLPVLFIIDNPKMRDKIGSDLAVSHMGFLLPNGKLRHASSESGFVVDTDFAEYAAARQANKNNLGVALYRIKND
ncbi:MAG: DUF1460 domain-containing protein [Rickettsiales bacterium]|jgi:hypothetical protein|nr:DUF1460 domain-containing protein [Rickettsiales bacterium]